MFARERFGPCPRDDDGILDVGGADALLPDEGTQRQHHARLDDLFTGRSGQRRRHEGEVVPEPQSSRHRHGGQWDPCAFVGGEEITQRSPHPARAEKTTAELVAAPGKLTVDGGVAIHRVRPTELADVPAEHHARLERHQVSRLSRRVPARAPPRVLARRDPRDVLVCRSGDARRRHGLHEHTRELPLGDAGGEGRRRLVQGALGDADRSPDRVDLLGRLDPPGPPQQWLTVDQPGRRERLREEPRRRWRHGIRGYRPHGGGALDPLQHLQEVPGVERDPVQVLVGNVVGDPFVPGAQEVHRPRSAHEDAPGTERSRTGGPKPRSPRDVPGVALTPDHEHVDVRRLHLFQHARPAGLAQRRIVGQDLGDRHRAQNGS